MLAQVNGNGIFQRINEFGLDVWQNEDDILDVKEITDFTESVNFLIKCENLKEFEELKTKLNIKTTKISYKDFISKFKL